MSITKNMSIIEDVMDCASFRAPFAVGDIVTHPSGRTVKIIAGQYWTPNGLCNHWYWRVVMSDGSLSETIENGYGWR